MESKKLDEYWLTFEKPESLPLPLNILELGEFATISTENFVAVEMGPVVDRQDKEEKGIAIAGLFLVKMESKKLDEYWLTFEKPESLPLPLNILELGEFATISTENFVAIEMGPVVDRQDNSISIRCRKALAKAYTKPGLIFHLDRYETNSSFPMLLNGVINFLDNNTEAKKLREVIVDKKMPTTTSLHSSDIATIKPLLKNLSRNQIRAVIKSLMINDYILIQGFPGSGKTSTIVGIVNCLVALGKNVLLTAYTNTAVDNMLLKLKEVLPEEKLLRIGGNQATFRIDEMKPLLLDQKLSKIENKKELLNEARSMLMKVPVVGTTCLTAANDQFFTWRSRFDYCIVDEAALAIQAAVLKPLMMGTKFILVGDCRQLEPLVLCTNAKNEGMTVSLMEELAPIAEKANVLICLNEQYRMNSRICELSSSLFYDGKLQCANEEIANRTIQINAIDEIAEEFDSELADIILSEKKECSVLFIDTQSREADGGIYHQDVTVAASKSNKGEVQLIKTICEVFVSAKIPGNSIGVMSTYRNQVDELRKNLPKSIETNTVDQFQGRDKDIILISLVHTSSMDEKQQNESHLSEKRLNVALTRAKKKLILVGCAESLSCFPLMKRVIEKIGIFHERIVSKMAAARGVKIAFAILVLIGFIFTLIAFVTPGWRHYKNGGDEPDFGLVTYDCGANGNQVNPSDCRQWWQSREPWEKAVIALMVFALIFEIICLAWALFSCTNFCCPSLYGPLPFLAFLSALCILVAFVVFAAKDPTDVEYIPSVSNQLNANHRPGYSFWLAVIGFGFMTLASLVGFFAYSLHAAEYGFIQRPHTAHNLH
uniref:DNA replication ATP-dependent helicase/nuclease n=1 Tax=Panagrolaimus sp. JU765 TaxID=591449 RepID=A0AC34RDG0_9BILA